LKTWDERAERVVLQLRPAGYPIPDVLQGGGDLRQQITRFRNPGKIVKTFLARVDDVRAWHQEAHRLYDFVRNKRHQVFERGRKLAEEIQRAEGVPGVEALAEADAQDWLATLTELAGNGQAAQQWEPFQAAYTPLRQRYRQVYEALHEKRDAAVAAAVQQLQAVGAPDHRFRPYQCGGLNLGDDGISCQRCHAALRELPLQVAALPNLVREERERYETATRYDGGDGPKIKRLRVAEIVPKRRIEQQQDIEEALEALGQAIGDALTEADAVELE
jgi:hypothetical protein